jgi:hypothetical protein
MTCPNCGQDGCTCNIVADSVVDTEVEVVLTEDEDRRQRVIECAAPYFNYDSMPEIRELLEFFNAMETWLKDGTIPPKPEKKKLETKFRIIGDDDVPGGGG